MTDSTAFRIRHQHVVLKLRHVLFTRGFLRKGPGQHELGLEHRARFSDQAIQGCCHPGDRLVKLSQLAVLNAMAGLALVPGVVELLGHYAELDDELAGQVGRANLAAFFLPKTDQGIFVPAHDDAGI